MYQGQRIGGRGPLSGMGGRCRLTGARSILPAEIVPDQIRVLRGSDRSVIAGDCSPNEAMALQIFSQNLSGEVDIGAGVKQVMGSESPSGDQSWEMDRVQLHQSGVKGPVRSL